MSNAYICICMFRLGWLHTEHFVCEGLFGIINFFLERKEERFGLELGAHALLHVGLDPFGSFLHDGSFF